MYVTQNVTLFLIKLAKKCNYNVTNVTKNVTNQ